MSNDIGIVVGAIPGPRYRHSPAQRHRKSLAETTIPLSNDIGIVARDVPAP